MPTFVNPAKPHSAPVSRMMAQDRCGWCNVRVIVLLSIFILTAGCGRQVDNHRFELNRVDASWSRGHLNATVQQKLTLSSEAKKALVYGVPLTLQLEIFIRSAGSRKPVRKSYFSYEIRYLPLSNYYQLTLPGGVEVRTFPRLRHLLAELSTVSLSFNTGDLPEGSYELRVRTRLDQEKMPPPMRLPMLFSDQWRHDSHWTTWPVEVNSGVHPGA